MSSEGNSVRRRNNQNRIKLRCERRLAEMLATTVVRGGDLETRQSRGVTTLAPSLTSGHEI